MLDPLLPVYNSISFSFMLKVFIKKYSNWNPLLGLYNSIVFLLCCKITINKNLGLVFISLIEAQIQNNLGNSIHLPEGV